MKTQNLIPAVDFIKKHNISRVWLKVLSTKGTIDTEKIGYALFVIDNKKSRNYSPKKPKN